MPAQSISPGFAAAYAQNSYRPIAAKRFPVGLFWAVALHIVVAYAVLSGKATDVIKDIQKPLTAVVIQEVILPPPPPPPPPAPEPLPSPKPVQTPVQEMAKPVAPAPVALPAAPAAAPAVQQAIIAPAPAVQAAAEAVPVKPTQVVITPPAPVTGPQAPSLEAEYIGRLRATIDAAKRYPTGRQASQQRPQGSVKLWFVLNRTGALVELGVFLGDASFLLEDAAKAAVRRSSFPPFPAGAWPSDEQHKFTTELNFVPPSGS